MNRARYEIVEDLLGEPLVIRDLGPWDRYVSVTNDAEAVVAELTTAGKLPTGRRLFYYDSDGIKDEIIHQGGIFLAFAPGPAPRTGTPA